MPRIWHDGTVVEAGRGIPAESVAGLRARGHTVLWHCEQPDPWPLGGGQLIAIDHETGTLIGAADPRLDDCALGF